MSPTSYQLLHSAILKIWQPPTLPGRLQPSTIGRFSLNLRVRYGNGCFPKAHRHQKSLSFVYTLKNKYCLLLTFFRSNPRTISIGQLHMLPCFHLQPIYLVVYKGSYSFRMGSLILRSVSRLDAFSVYQLQTWLLCYRLGSLTDAPAVRSSRSSRTKDNASQTSYAHDG